MCMLNSALVNQNLCLKKKKNKDTRNHVMHIKLLCDISNFDL